MDHTTLERLLAASKGEEPLDALIVNGKIVDVFTDTVDEGRCVGIKDGFIVSVTDEAKEARPAAREVIDAAGRFLCPGFIDSHTHLDTMYPFHELVPYAIRGGTTTVITECAMVANACGMQGVVSFIESTRGYPLRCYFTAPPLTPPFPTMEGSKGISYAEFARLLKRPDVLGIGEGYWTRIVDGDERLMKQAALAVSLGKTVEGHAAGARGGKLVQYVVSGVTSCHESTSVEEALEKLRLGIYVMVREGFVRKELPELHKLKDLPFDRRRLILVSDVFDAAMLAGEGYMDSLVRKAVGYGFPVIDAIKTVTINPADYFGLRHLGAIAPLRHADIIFLNDLETITIDSVMTNGEIVLSDGSYRKPVTPHAFPASAQRTLNVDKLTERDFCVPARGDRRKVRVLDAVNETICRETSAVLEVRGGCLQGSVADDVIPLAVINRTTGRMGKGFIHGTGIKSGAVATTVIWDTCNIFVVGSSEADMAMAVNRLIDLQGGYTLVHNGKVIYEFPMPVFGLIPLCTMEEAARLTAALPVEIRKIGATLTSPFLTLQTVPFTGLPFLRITDKGLVDVRQRRLVPLMIE